MLFSSSKKDKPRDGGLKALFKRGLAKTRDVLTRDIGDLIGAARRIDADLLEEIECLLLSADVGFKATERLIGDLNQRLGRKELADGEALFSALRAKMVELLEPVARPLVVTNRAGQPFSVLMVGINGAGKTTSIGKLAKRMQHEGRSVMLAAGDTFRAAAVEQLQVWGQRNDVAVVAQHNGADSASVVFDALESARSRGIDVLIADTAGRLHTQDNLMEELKKIRRVMGKLDAQAPDEVLLVLDAGIGQNAINQAREFSRAVGVTGIALTKLDGTAKGGIVFALAEEFDLPIRFIGVGEGIDDLRPFEAEPFVDALLAH